MIYIYRFGAQIGDDKARAIILSRAALDHDHGFPLTLEAQIEQLKIGNPDHGRKRRESENHYFCVVSYPIHAG